jgi:hypothetical protein
MLVSTLYGHQTQVLQLVVSGRLDSKRLLKSVFVLALEVERLGSQSYRTDLISYRLKRRRAEGLHTYTLVGPNS